MQLIARIICALAATVFLAAPSTVLAGVTDAYPASDYARGATPSDCTATIREPVVVAVQGFSNAALARNTLADETAWNDLPAPDPSQSQHLTMQDVPGNTSTAHCRGEMSGLLSPLSSDQQHRTHALLWPNATNGVVAGAAYRQVKTTSECGASSGSPKWITTPDGFNAGRDSLETAFQGPTPSYGPYPVQEVDWGNTARIDQCDGSRVGSDGNVAIIQPKDSYGYNDDWRSFSANPDAPPAQNPRELAQDQGATVARYAINWGVVGLAGSVPVTPTNCLQMGGNWGSLTVGYDRAYTYVTGRQPCDDTPPTTGIRPVLAVLGAPPAYARWCNQSDDAQCGAGDCIATSDQTPPPPQRDFTNPAVAASTAADNDWKGFVQNVALRYPLARGIEIWNEPNLTKDYWGSCLPGPTRYAQLLKKAHEGVVDSGTGTKVVLAGMSPQEGATDNRKWTNYLNAVFAADPAVPTLFDVMGLHPYRSTQDLPDGFALAAANDVQMARDDVLAPNGIPLRTIWVTEVGATIANTNTGTEVPGATTAEREANQSTALGSIYYRLRNMVPVVIVHRLVDPPPDMAEGPGYGAVTRAAQDPHPPDGRRPYYFALCQRRAITGGLCSQP